MLQEIKNLQSKAVSKLLFKINNQREVTFKAPTGSGKTFMMADLMNKILVKPDVVFIVSTLSKAGLGKQNYEKFIEYLPSFSNLKPYLINSDFAPDEKIYIPEDHNVYVLPRDLYKDKSRIKSSGALFNLLLTLNFSGKQVYLIKDECHIATNNLDELNGFKNLIEHHQAYFLRASHGEIIFGESGQYIAQKISEEINNKNE